MEYRHSTNLFSLPDNVVKICPFDDHLGNGFAVLKDLLDKISWLQLGMIALLGIPSSIGFGHFMGISIYYNNSKDLSLDGSYIQSFFNIFVLIAGYWAYMAATRETRRKEKRDKARCQSYRKMMRLVIENLLKKVTELLDNYDEKKLLQDDPTFESNPEEVKRKGYNPETHIQMCPTYSPPTTKEEICIIENFSPFLIAIPSTINPENWENHALLKENEVDSIFSLHEKLTEYQSFQEEINKREREKDKIEGKMHQETYLKHAKDLNSLLQQLSKSLKEPYS